MPEIDPKKPFVQHSYLLLKSRPFCAILSADPTIVDLKCFFAYNLLSGKHHPTYDAPRLMAAMLKVLPQRLRANDVRQSLYRLRNLPTPERLTKRTMQILHSDGDRIPEQFRFPRYHAKLILESRSLLEIVALAVGVFRVLPAGYFRIKHAQLAELTGHSRQEYCRAIKSLVDRGAFRLSEERLRDSKIHGSKIFIVKRNKIIDTDRPKTAENACTKTRHVCTKTRHQMHENPTPPAPRTIFSDLLESNTVTLPPLTFSENPDLVSVLTAQTTIEDSNLIRAVIKQSFSSIKQEIEPWPNQSQKIP